MIYIFIYDNSNLPSKFITEQPWLIELKKKLQQTIPSLSQTKTK